MIKLLKHLFFVRTCLGCGTAIPDAEDDTVFCPGCFRKYMNLRSEICLRCGKRVDACKCLPESLRYKVVWSGHLFFYHVKLSERIVYTMKMKNYKPLQRFLANELANLIFDASGGDLSGYAVTFAPRKPGSVCTYGFDHAKVLAELTASKLGLPVEKLFRHARFSKVQKELNSKERQYNARISYSLNDYVCRKTDRLIIIDDIMTTGSTFSALVSLAEALGYREIAIISVAKAG